MEQRRAGRVNDPGRIGLEDELLRRQGHAAQPEEVVRGVADQIRTELVGGGETEFADLRAAYDAMPEDMKQDIAHLETEHFALHSRFALGDTDYTPEQIAAIPPVRWPLVQVHPGSGRRLLFVGVHARAILGMSLPEGRLLLSDLLEHATRRDFVYGHEWRVGDLVMWDNRATVHRGRRFDLSERRELRRSTTEDLPARQMATA